MKFTHRQIWNKKNWKKLKSAKNGVCDNISNQSQIQQQHIITVIMNNHKS